LTNNTAADLAAGAALATFAVQTTADSFNEADEIYGLTIAGGSGVAVEGTATITTTITDDDAATIKLTGAASVAEGSSANYAVSLDGVGLGAGRSLTFSLDTASGTATEGADFAALLAGALTAASGVTLNAISTDPITKAVTLTATNTSGADLAANTQLLSFAVAAAADAIAEGNETYTVSLTSGTATVSTGTVTTTIKDLGGGGGGEGSTPTPAPAVIKLTAISPTAAGLVTEGRSANYAVSLDGVVLGVGGSVTLTLDTASGTATEGADFAAFTAGALTAASGVTLNAISTDPITKAVTMTATNTSSGDLAAGAQLLSFVVTTFTDSIAENSETFTVSLSSTTAKVSAPALITTVITDAPADPVSSMGKRINLPARAGSLPFVLDRLYPLSQQDPTGNPIRDFDGNPHGFNGGYPAGTERSYKYQGQADLNGDGNPEQVFTNRVSSRWATVSVDPITGQTDYSKNGQGGSTRVVGIYVDPLVAEGEANNGFLLSGEVAPKRLGPFDSQQRFQNDLRTDNLQLKASADYNGDGLMETYWKVLDGTAFLHTYMHADGNIQYSNYQSLQEMTAFLTPLGYADVIPLITA
jgi:hypothetical protein